MGDHWTSQGLQILSLTPRKRKKILWQKHGKLEDEKYLKEKNTKKIYIPIPRNTTKTMNKNTMKNKRMGGTDTQTNSATSRLTGMALGLYQWILAGTELKVFFVSTL